ASLSTEISNCPAVSATSRIFRDGSNRKLASMTSEVKSLKATPSCLKRPVCRFKSYTLMVFLEARNPSSCPASISRSEERRVGKECRYRWSPDREKGKEGRRERRRPAER